MRKHTPDAGGRIEIGKKRRNPRRAGQQPCNVAIRARVVLFFERDVAVGIDECIRLILPVVREVERHVQLTAIVVRQRQPCAEIRAEAALDPPDVVSAGAVSGETKTQAAKIVRVWRFDQIAFVLDHRDLSHVDVVSSGGERLNLGDAAGPGLVQPQRVQHAASRVAVEDVFLARDQVRRRLRWSIDGLGLQPGCRARILSGRRRRVPAIAGAIPATACEL
jgi:hypothetical protein